MKLDIRDNFPTFLSDIRAVQRDLRDKVMAQALNKVADKAKTEAVRAITAEYVIKASEIRPRFSIRRASARGAHLIAELEAFGRRRGGRAMNIIHFLERSVSLAEGRRRARSGTLSQLRFRIKRGGGLKTILGAFVVTANRGTFVARRAGKERLPIEAVQVIDLPQMFTSTKINQRVVRKILDEFPVEFSRAMANVLRRSGR